jgi:PAS domain S-box-containing protein
MCKLMLVDDEVVIISQLEEIVVAKGYEVIGMATSGKEAIEMAKDVRPDLILMDIMMPGEIDGITAAEQIKTETDIPVIFLTAYSEQELVDRAKCVEPLGYILKPFQERQITTAIEIAFYKGDVERRLRESEDLYRNLVQTIVHGIQEIDLSGNITFANSACHKIFGYEEGGLLKKPLYDLIALDSDKQLLHGHLPGLGGGQPALAPLFIKGTRKDGTIIDTQMDWNSKLDQQGHVTGFISIVTDISERARADEALRKAHDELERRVEERTAQLIKANQDLEREIAERKRTEDVLKAKRKELQTQSTTLEEANTALRVLLKRREEDKIELEEKVLLNVKELVIPFLERLKKSGLDAIQMGYASVLESSLDDIISPFSRRLSLTFLNLTPSEMQVANLVKHGKTTKEIAELLKVSKRTIESHRESIRGKIGIKNEKANLRTFLSSLF